MKAAETHAFHLAHMGLQYGLSGNLASIVATLCGVIETETAVSATRQDYAGKTSQTYAIKFTMCVATIILCEILNFS